MQEAKLLQELAVAAVFSEQYGYQHQNLYTAPVCSELGKLRNLFNLLLHYLRTE